MKILNIFPIDWNSPDCLPERTWTIPNERGDNFNWITGMFHETITSKINLDLNYNQLADINQIKKLSDKNIPYNIFVKFYQFRHLVGVDVDNETIKDEISFSLSNFAFLIKLSYLSFSLLNNKSLTKSNWDKTTTFKGGLKGLYIGNTYFWQLALMHLSICFFIFFNSSISLKLFSQQSLLI